MFYYQAKVSTTIIIRNQIRDLIICIYCFSFVFHFPSSIWLPVRMQITNHIAYARGQIGFRICLSGASFLTLLTITGLSFGGQSVAHCNTPNAGKQEKQTAAINHTTKTTRAEGNRRHRRRQRLPLTMRQ